MTTDGTAIVADGHVHLHDCYELPVFLRAAQRLHDVALPFPAAKRACLLMLTEGAGERAFERAGERFEPTAEPESLRWADGERALYLVAGCQIASSDGLEVLLLASRRRVPDGLPMRETLERAMDSGGPCVIPWGVGKWWGRRGRLLRELIDEYGPRGLFLGDESGRPWFWPRPAMLDRPDVLDLPGTDPLPFPGEAGKVGRMGFALPGASWDDARPAASLKNALAAAPGQPFRFARLESTLPFLVNQVRMQWRKRG